MLLIKYFLCSPDPKAGHSTHFQEKHFDIFIFENKVAGEKIQLDGQFARCPAAVECPAKGHVKYYLQMASVIL